MKNETLKDKGKLDKEVPRIFYWEKDVKQFIKEILDEIDEIIVENKVAKRVKEIIKDKIKQKSGFELK